MGNHGGNEGSPISHEYINNIISCPHPTPCLDSTSKFLPIIVRVKMRFYASPVNNNPSSISPFIIRRLATRFFLPAIHESSLYSSIASIKNTHTPRNVLKKKKKERTHCPLLKMRIRNDKDIVVAQRIRHARNNKELTKSLSVEDASNGWI